MAHITIENILKQIEELPSIEQWRLHNLFRMLEEEYEWACLVTLRITGERRLLDQSPALQRSIAVRNPHVDPLSFLHVELLARRRKKDGKVESSAGAENAEGARRVYFLTSRLVFSPADVDRR